jgi:heptaprenyl diphosphate synthase
MTGILMRQSGSPVHRVLTGHDTALLGSLCLFRSAIEYVIPNPLPFIRIGLANLPLLLALDIAGPLDFFLLTLLKVIGQGLISGTLFSYVFLFSLLGTFSSAAFMYVMRHIIGQRHSSFIGIGCAGAMASNSVQLLLARYLIFGAGNLRYLIPPFLLSGFITGIALGLFCEIFCRRSRWYAGFFGGTHAGQNALQQEFVDPPSSECSDKPAGKNSVWEKHRLLRRHRWNGLFNSKAFFIAGLLMAGLFVFNPSIIACTIMFVLFCFLAWLSGKKINVPITLAIFAGIIFFNLLAPYGKMLFELGPLRITRGSLLAGLRKALVLEGLVMLSGACIKSDLRFPGKFGSLLADSFRLLELMRERKTIIRRGHIIEGIDKLLLEMESQYITQAHTA